MEHNCGILYEIAIKGECHFIFLYTTEKSVKLLPVMNGFAV